MEYTVNFDFNTINKKSMISGKKGMMNITSEASLEQLQQSDDLIKLIAFEMEKSTKQKVLSVDNVRLAKI